MCRDQCDQSHVGKKVKSGKKSRKGTEAQKGEQEPIVDESVGLHANPALVKPKKRKTLHSVSESIELEQEAPPQKKRKNNSKAAPRKAAKQLSKQLENVQMLLQNVKTASELEVARAALLELQQGIPTQNQGQAVGQQLQSGSPQEQQTGPKAEDKIVERGTAIMPDRIVAATDKKVSEGFRRNFATWAVVNEKKASKRRKTLGVEIEDGDSVLPPVLSFGELEVLPGWITKALEENGWSKPTAIQSQALPVLLSGRNLVGVAQTGSGKTGAFLLPSIIHIDAQPKLSRHSAGPVVLCIAPTRELAVQISEEADKMLKYSSKSSSHPQGIFSACFYGGGRKQDQLRRFTTSGSHIVVATPGRLVDFVTNNDVNLSRVTYLVLDEADRMLDEGFSGELHEILSHVRVDRQVALFSATWPTSVQALADAFMPPAREGTGGTVRIRVGGAKASSETVAAGGGDGVPTVREGIKQEVVVVDIPAQDWKKAEAEKRLIMDKHIREVLTSSSDSKMLVFVNTKALADDLSTKLWKDGFQADSMHGGRPQETRLSVLKRFREGNLRLLVVTDVFSRGLDIPQVSHVVIYEMGEITDYVHRIGRTGRGVGGTGHALVFFEYWPAWPKAAQELIGVLERSKQRVPQELRNIAAEVIAGKRPTR